jgi:hypothetical protein
MIHKLISSKGSIFQIWTDNKQKLLRELVKPITLKPTGLKYMEVTYNFGIQLSPRKHGLHHENNH